jgi:hypothetical protein
MRHLYGGRERGDLLDSPMGALEENYQDFCSNYVQEFGLCMRHLYGGERGDLPDSPMGALEENYQDFCPNYTSKNSASVCGICMVGERGDLPDSPMGELEENYQDFCPNYVQEFGLCMRHLYGEREVISLIVPWESWRKTIKTFVPITRPRIRPLYAASVWWGERGDLADSLMGALEENYQGFLVQLHVQEFGLCMRHICMVGER